MTHPNPNRHKLTPGERARIPRAPRNFDPTGRRKTISSGYSSSRRPVDVTYCPIVPAPSSLNPPPQLPRPLNPRAPIYTPAPQLPPPRSRTPISISSRTPSRPKTPQIPARFQLDPNKDLKVNNSPGRPPTAPPKKGKGSWTDPPRKPPGWWFEEYYRTAAVSEPDMGSWVKPEPEVPEKKSRFTFSSTGKVVGCPGCDTDCTDCRNETALWEKYNKNANADSDLDYPGAKGNYKKTKNDIAKLAKKYKKKNPLESDSGSDLDFPGANGNYKKTKINVHKIAEKWHTGSDTESNLDFPGANGDYKKSRVDVKRLGQGFASHHGANITEDRDPWKSEFH